MMDKELFHKITERLAEITKGTRFDGNCYAVGGSVRDLVMGNPIKDIDICVTLPDGGTDLAEWLFDNGFLTHEPVTYPTYGTSMFKLLDFPGDEIEAVHTRREQYKDKNSRNPVTEYGTLEEDAFRRDLTINALYYDISRKRIIDPTGMGNEDIVRQVIRITNSDPDIVLSDDPLRILRICRFASRFGWEIEENTYKSMVKNVGRLSIITHERIKDEFNKMLLSDNPVMAVGLIKEIGAMKYVIPELEETYGMGQNKFHFGTVYEHTMATLGHASDISKGYGGNDKLVLRMAALLHDIGKIECRTVDEKGNVHFYGHEFRSAELCDKVLKRLKYPNNFIGTVKVLVENHMRTKNWGGECEYMKGKKLREMWHELGKDFGLCLDLIHADNLSHKVGHCLPLQVPHIKDHIKLMLEEGIDMETYKLPVDGHDVMETLGISGGAEVKECLDWLMRIAYSFPKMDRKRFLGMIKQYKKG